jgi:hypothetical protein
MTKRRSINSRHERSTRSYDRRPGKRIPGRCTLIVCEGAETEPNYFHELRKYLKLSTIQLKIIDRAGAPISLVDEARRQVEHRKQEIRKEISNIGEYEDVWCVFDTENPHHNPTFNDAVRTADECNYFLAISNPAFEFWYILHFDSITRPFQKGGEVKEFLRRYIPDYKESMSVFSRLISLTTLAIQRAEDNLQNHPAGVARFPNPSTRAHLLVRAMIDMSPSGRVHF